MEKKKAMLGVGSLSPRKLFVPSVVLRQLGQTDCEWNVTGVDAPSKVPDTPWGRQTFIGARNRAIGARAVLREADITLGQESGLTKRYGVVSEEAYCVATDIMGNEYRAYSSGMPVPQRVLDLMKDQGISHGEAMSQLEAELGIDSSSSETLGTYTNGVLTREVMIQEAVRNVLIQALHIGLY